MLTLSWDFLNFIAISCQLSETEKFDKQFSPLEPSRIEFLKVDLDDKFYWRWNLWNTSDHLKIGNSARIMFQSLRITSYNANISIDPLSNELILLKPAIVFTPDGCQDSRGGGEDRTPPSLPLMTLWNITLRNSLCLTRGISLEQVNVVSLNKQHQQDTNKPDKAHHTK